MASVTITIFITGILSAWKFQGCPQRARGGSLTGQGRGSQCARPWLRPLSPLPLTYHTGEQLPVVVAGHPSGAVELKPAVLAGSHAQQARVDLPQGESAWSAPADP